MIIASIYFKEDASWGTPKEVMILWQMVGVGVSEHRFVENLPSPNETLSWNSNVTQNALDPKMTPMLASVTFESLSWEERQFSFESLLSYFPVLQLWLGESSTNIDAQIQRLQQFLRIVNYHGLGNVYRIDSPKFQILVARAIRANRFARIIRN